MPKVPLSEAALDALIQDARQEAYRRIAARPKRILQAYRNDPVGFVYDCIDWSDNEDAGPTPYQIEILDSLVNKRRVCVRSPHGAGKTCLAAWTILWFALTRDGVDDWKVVTTASAHRQLTLYLWPEIHKWARKLDWSKIGRPPFDERQELLVQSIRLSTGAASAVASNKEAFIEGAHASQMLYAYDESKEIPASIFDAAEGAYSTGEAYGLSISTPGAPIGRFFEIQTKRDKFPNWWCRHITMQEALACGRMLQSWVNDCRLTWGENSAIYKNRVLGEFATSEEENVIPFEWLEAAHRRWQEWQDAGAPLGEFTCVGVDVAREGEDKTVIAVRHGNIITNIIKHHKEDTMQTTGRVVGVLSWSGGTTAVVDVVGIGAGVVDRLLEQGYNAVGLNAGAASRMRDATGQFGFADVRSEMWWNLREMLDPSKDSQLAIPPDNELTGDLLAVNWRIASGGKIKVQGKDESWRYKDGVVSTLRKRLDRSTDAGDAVVQAFSNYALGNEVEVVKL